MCRVVNEPLESIAHNLGFNGNSLAEGFFFFTFTQILTIYRIICIPTVFSELLCNVNEGLVVSTCLGGAFIGSLFSGWIADEFGRRRTFQLCALPMIIGAACR